MAPGRAASPAARDDRGFARARRFEIRTVEQENFRFRNIAKPRRSRPGLSSSPFRGSRAPWGFTLDCWFSSRCPRSLRWSKSRTRMSFPQVTHDINNRGDVVGDALQCWNASLGPCAVVDLGRQSNSPAKVRSWRPRQRRTRPAITSVRHRALFSRCRAMRAPDGECRSSPACTSTRTI